MTQPQTYRVTLIGFEGDSAAGSETDVAGGVNLAALEQGLRDGWPDGGDRLAFHHCTLAEAIEQPQRLPDGPCVVQTPLRGVRVEHLKLFDQLSIRLLPIIMFGPADTGAKLSRLLESGEYLAWTPEMPAAEMAHQLYALCRRQNTVRRLSSELRLAHRSQGGMYGEMSRIEEEMQLAAVIQREMLPRMIPEVNDVRFGVLFRPAGYVSGDAYTVERLDEHTIGFFLTDAVGHGVPAALMTMVMIRNLRMKEIAGHTYRIIPPGEVLERLNTDMLRSLGTGGRFATGVYGLIDTRTYRVRLANAGHPAPLWFSPADPDGYRPLRPTGGLLGVFPDQRYEEVEFELAPDERLVVFSDGFEIVTPSWSSKVPRNAAPSSGGSATPKRSIESQYAEFFAEFYGVDQSPGEAIIRLAQRMNRLDGSLHQIDDITALILGRDATAGANVVDRWGEVTSRSTAAASIPSSAAA